MEKKQARSESSGGQNSSSNSEKKRKSSSSRHARRSIHETFEWGFVSGGEDSDFGKSHFDDSHKTAPKEKKQDTKKQDTKKKAVKSSSSPPAQKPSGSQNGKERQVAADKITAKKANIGKAVSPKTPPSKKQAKPKAANPIDWDDSDDDLTLPSYGRTSLPTVSSVAQASNVHSPPVVHSPLEKTASRKKKEKPPVQAAPPPSVDTKSTGAKDTGKKRPEKKPSGAEPKKTETKMKTGPKTEPKVQSVAGDDPTASSTGSGAVKKKHKSRAAKLVCTTIPPLPRRKRQHWDPEKREYVLDEEPVANEPEPDKKRNEKEERAGKSEKTEKPKSKSTPAVKSPEKSPEKSTEKKAKIKKATDEKPTAKKASVKKPVDKEQPVKAQSVPQTTKKIAVQEPVAKEQRGQKDSKGVKPRTEPDVMRDITPAAPVSTQVDPEDMETTPEGFKTLPLSDTMIEALSVVRYLEPTPIQLGVIPHVIQGIDVLGQAQTGTGKTAAFLIPIIEGIEECEPGDAPVALILVPTRELAVQVRDEALKLSYGRDIRVVACYGGKPIAKNIMRLREGADILIGTPGRLLDLMKRGVLSCAALRWTVLDEADRMLDIGFRPDIEKILARTPSNRQTLLFSATLPPQVIKLAKKYMVDPMILDFSPSTVAVDTIEQYYITVDYMRKFDALVQLLKQEEPNQAIIFCRTKRGADRVGRMLESHFSSIATIHGDLPQSTRDRVMSQFRAGTLRYLVATDVVGRGIDVSGISHIINYDIPTFCDDYVHRVGRTGRMGRDGIAFTFVTAEEGAELTRIEMRIDRLLKRAELDNFEAFAKPTDGSITDPFAPPQGKPVFGKPVRKVRRAL